MFSCPIFYYYNSIGLGIGSSNFNGQYFRNIQVSKEGQINWRKDGHYRRRLNYNLSLSSSDAKQEHLRNIKLGIASNEFIGGYSFGTFLSPSIQYSHGKQEGVSNHYIGPGIELNLRPYSKWYTFFKFSFEYTRLMNLKQLSKGGNYWALNLSFCLSTINGKPRKSNRSSGGLNF